MCTQEGISRGDAPACGPVTGGQWAGKLVKSTPVSGASSALSTGFYWTCQHDPTAGPAGASWGRPGRTQEENHLLAPSVSPARASSQAPCSLLCFRYNSHSSIVEFRSGLPDVNTQVRPAPRLVVSERSLPDRPDPGEFLSSSSPSPDTVPPARKHQDRPHDNEAHNEDPAVRKSPRSPSREHGRHQKLPSSRVKPSPPAVSPCVSVKSATRAVPPAGLLSGVCADFVLEDSVRTPQASDGRPACRTHVTSPRQPRGPRRPVPRWTRGPHLSPAGPRQRRRRRSRTTSS